MPRSSAPATCSTGSTPSSDRPLVAALLATGGAARVARRRSVV
ncbi:MYXO-CTERM sorting domain-containing protein [Marinimicrococcus flavescens]